MHRAPNIIEDNLPVEAEGSNACDEPVAVNNKNENSPKEPFNGPSPDNLDMGTAIPDGLSNELSDPDNLSEDDEVVLISDLQQFYLYCKMHSATLLNC